MSIEYYSKIATDWETRCVASGGSFKGYGAGVWVFEFRSASVCPKPVVFAFAGVGAGAGTGVSGSSSSIDTTSDRQKAMNQGPKNYPGSFTKLECIIPFSLMDLNATGGRLAVGEVYLWGLGGGIVVISAFSLRKNYFNSQNIIGDGVSPTKLGGTLAITGGIWKSEFLTHMIPSRTGSSSDSPADDVCSIYDSPKFATGQRTHKFQRPRSGTSISRSR